MHEYMKRKLEFGVTILPDPNSNPKKVSRFNESAQIDNTTELTSQHSITYLVQHSLQT